MRRSFVLLLLFMGTNFVYTRNWNHILDSIYAIQNINIPNSPELFQLQFISYDKLRRDVKTELFSNIDKRDIGLGASLGLSFGPSNTKFIKKF